MPLSQSVLERKVFEKFATHTGLNVVSFQSCDTRKPDIFCQTERGNLYFELTDNTSGKIQESVHTKDEATRNRAYWINPFPESYKQKFKKRYDTDSLDCELVIYFGIHPVLELGAHFQTRLQENIEWIEQHIHQSQFGKVWIYDYHQDQVLACIKRST